MGSLLFRITLTIFPYKNKLLVVINKKTSSIHFPLFYHSRTESKSVTEARFMRHAGRRQASVESASTRSTA